MKKMTTANPYEAVAFMIEKGDIKKLKIQCLGFLNYSCVLNKKAEPLDISVDGEDIVIVGKTENRFTIKLISNVTFVQHGYEENYDGPEVFNINIVGTYLQQFIKDEITNK